MRLNQALSYLSLGFAVITVARLIQQRLILKSPFFAFGCMLAIGSMRDIFLHLLPYHTHEYAVAWEVTLAPLLAGHIWATCAAYRRIASQYPKAGSSASWFFLSCISVAVILCCALTPFETAHISGPEIILRTAFLVYRWLDTSCGVGLLLAVLILSRLPAPMKRPASNVAIHTVLLAAYFCIHSLHYFAANLWPLGGDWIDETQFVCVLAVYSGWIFMLSEAGEESSNWPGLDPAITQFLDRQYYAALSRLRSAVR